MAMRKALAPDNAACQAGKRLILRHHNVSKCLLERIEDAERDFLLGPVVGRVAEHVKQDLARFLVEFLRIWQLLEHHQKARLRAGLEHGVRQAQAQGIEIFRQVFRKQECFCNNADDLLFGLSSVAMRI